MSQHVHAAEFSIEYTYSTLLVDCSREQQEDVIWTWNMALILYSTVPAAAAFHTSCIYHGPAWMCRRGMHAMEPIQETWRMCDPAQESHIRNVQNDGVLKRMQAALDWRCSPKLTAGREHRGEDVYGCRLCTQTCLSTIYQRTLTKGHCSSCSKYSVLWSPAKSYAIHLMVHPRDMAS